jgi:putative ABC transport system permease protein
MFSNYFKVLVRNLVKNKMFSLLNILGLSIGLATCLLISLYIFDEASYDKHHVDGDRVFRIVTTSNGQSWAALPPPFAAAAKNDLPDIEEATRLLKFPDVDNMLISYTTPTETRRFFETDGFYVDSNFFRVVSYPFKYGNPATALGEPNSIVLSEPIARRLFGDTDPIGRPISIGLSSGENMYKVKGVLAANTPPSHIPTGFFLSMKNGDIGRIVEGMRTWTGQNIFHTYVKLKAGVDTASFSKKLKPFFDRYGGAEAKAAGMNRTFILQPLERIYLHSDIGDEIAANGNIKSLYILGSIAAFILIIACINFMNLSTARSEKRAREVGVRKVMGAGKSSLVLQFLAESVLTSFCALAVALLLAGLFLPSFNTLTQKSLGLFVQPSLIVWMVVLTLLTGIVAGLYPAFYLSGFQPVRVLKGRVMSGLSAIVIRKSLVVFQFAVSVCLIFGALVISLQLNYLRSQDLGFNPNQQLVLPLKTPEGAGHYEALKDELVKRSFVKSVSAGSGYPGLSSVVSDMLFYAQGKTQKDFVDVNLTVTESDYLQTLGLPLLYGRPFSKNITTDSGSVILNETAVRKLGYDPRDAVGKKIYYELMQPSRKELEIVGVVKDFHFESLHETIKPFGFTTTYFANRDAYLIVNLTIGNYPKQLAEIESDWKKINPNTPFVYSFLDQDFERSYRRDQRDSQIVIYFTGIAIFIACLGLFGLAVFSAERRTREIGIRKVLGATVTEVTVLLSKDFIRLVLVAILIGSPLAWWAMNKWLEAFAYMIHLQWWMFGVSGAIAVLIAILTVSFQAIRAGNANPVKSLRSE